MKTLISLMLIAASAFAQDTKKDKPPLPPGPIIKPLPELAAWAIIFKDPGVVKGENADDQQKDAAKPEGSPAKAPRFIVITKSGKTYREVETDADGQKTERWKVDGTEVSIAPDGKTSITDGVAAEDFDELKWISAANYVNVANVDGQPCFVFQDKIHVPDVVGDLDATAGISTATQLPVYCIIGGSPQIYKFGKQSVPLTVPEIVQQALANRKQVIGNLMKRP